MAWYRELDNVVWCALNRNRSEMALGIRTALQRVSRPLPRSARPLNNSLYPQRAPVRSPPWLSRDPHHCRSLRYITSHSHTHRPILLCTAAPHTLVAVTTERSGTSNIAKFRRCTSRYTHVHTHTQQSLTLFFRPPVPRPASPGFLFPSCQTRVAATSQPSGRWWGRRGGGRRGDWWRSLDGRVGRGRSFTSSSASETLRTSTPASSQVRASGGWP